MAITELEIVAWENDGGLIIACFIFICYTKTLFFFNERCGYQVTLSDLFKNYGNKPPIINSKIIVMSETLSLKYHLLRILFQLNFLCIYTFYSPIKVGILKSKFYNIKKYEEYQDM